MLVGSTRLSPLVVVVVHRDAARTRGAQIGLSFALLTRPTGSETPNPYKLLTDDWSPSS